MVSHQHGLHSMNSSRPKSKLYKRRNKIKARERKEVLLKQLKEATEAFGTKKTEPAGPAGVAKETDTPKKVEKAEKPKTSTKPEQTQIDLSTTAPTE